MTVPFTMVSFHAHPDDEALLTAGTLARAAADGHRVVLVVATEGERGLAAESFTTGDLGGRRRQELAASARALGVARVVVLGHGDSGWSPPGAGVDPAAAGSAPRFCELDPEEVARELAGILRAEQADVLTSYDAAGGYGHPDHVMVHRVGQRAAELAGTPLVLEATVDRRALRRGVRVLRALAWLVGRPEMPDLNQAFTPRDHVTHAVDVRRQLAVKKRCLAAHASQASADSGTRTLALLRRLPWPLDRWVLGREWFREVGRPPGGPLLDDVFASLRPGTPAGQTDAERLTPSSR